MLSVKFKFGPDKFQHPCLSCTQRKSAMEVHLLKQMQCTVLVSKQIRTVRPEARAHCAEQSRTFYRSIANSIFFDLQHNISSAEVGTKQTSSKTCTMTKQYVYQKDTRPIHSIVKATSASIYRPDGMWKKAHQATTYVPHMLRCSNMQSSYNSATILAQHRIYHSWS